MFVCISPHCFSLAFSYSIWNTLYQNYQSQMDVSLHAYHVTLLLSTKNTKAIWVLYNQHSLFFLSLFFHHSSLLVSFLSISSHNQHDNSKKEEKEWKRTNTFHFNVCSLGKNRKKNWFALNLYIVWLYWIQFVCVYVCVRACGCTRHYYSRPVHHHRFTIFCFAN